MKKLTSQECHNLTEGLIAAKNEFLLIVKTKNPDGKKGLHTGGRGSTSDFIEMLVQVGTENETLNRALIISAAILKKKGDL